jgi:5'-methylthioadenosine phosphorylase
MIGIIGGSGLDDPNILKNAKDIEVNTVYGKPSSLLKVGEINGKKVCLLSRHGREHKIPPTQVPFRANIQALKDAGVTQIIATTACGSLREEIKRGDLVILDQFIDFTRHRKITYYEEFPGGAKNAKHIAMPEPFDKRLRKLLIENAKKLKLNFHEKGTVITIEGPRFSTRAESRMFRIWGADVINMSIAPEAILANEAEIPYAAIAMATDYDSWHEEEKTVTWKEILEIFEKNVENVKKLLIETVSKI